MVQKNKKSAVSKSKKKAVLPLEKKSKPVVQSKKSSALLKKSKVSPNTATKIVSAATYQASSYSQSHEPIRLSDKAPIQFTPQDQAPWITDFDRYLLGEGTHFKSYEKLGSHLGTKDGVAGVYFCIWAPNAKAISVIGDFNRWIVGVNNLDRLPESEFWVGFIAGLKEGDYYKYAIHSEDDKIREKSDPYAFFSEIRPKTASVVTSLDHHGWQDAAWMAQRHERNSLEAPISIYEVHLGSWKRSSEDASRFKNYRELAHELVEYAKNEGYTHIELMPIMEHPLDESWGYQVLSYFAPTSRFGSPQDFMYFVDYCHRHNIGVILDWVPAHFPQDPHGLANFDGREIYAYDDWKKREHKDWGTFVFNYANPKVRNFLTANALFWFDKYHIDGLRVDAVASMIYRDYSRKPGEWDPNEYGGRENLEAIDFLKRLNETVHLNYPGVLTMAEESTSWTGVSRPTYTGGLGFSMKWNMGWMHDTLEYFCKEPVHRRFHQNMLTFSMLYAFTENFVLPISHDEVVHGKHSLLEKMPGDDWQKFANLRLFLGYMFGHPGKKLNFMTNDIAQRDEWCATKSMDWHLTQYQPHQQIQYFMRDLNKLYVKNKPLYEVDFEWQGFEWIDFLDHENSVLSFIRWSKDRSESVVFTLNLTPVPRFVYRIGVPVAGYYKEILNSDAAEYGGSGIGNLGGVASEDFPWHGRPYSVQVNLPPLSVNIFKPQSR
ncbi:MAG TPA: 1,4-alpha-glucan branching protein GlgB [Candidatus Omnitrophota bacterium]|nr:1,4-alpha-glucan branching protein GlgB [Candidatus Omnitrophota bacterium]